LKYVEQAFFAESKEFLAGITLSVADLFVFVQLDTVVQTISNFDLSPFPKVNNWYKLMLRREGVSTLSKFFGTVAGSIAPPTTFDPHAEVEEAAAEEAEASEVAAEEQEVAEEAEAAAEEEPEEEENLSLDDLVADDDDDDEETKKMFAAKKDLVDSITERQKQNAGKAKSNLTLDVKPFDTETDMGALEQKIRLIELEGMKWLGGQLVDVAYGIKKLRIMCQIVDSSGLSPDTIREEIEKFEDEVQSTDVFAFQMA